MSKTKKIFIILAVFLILAGIGLLAATFSMTGGEFKNIGTVEYESGEMSVTEDFSSICIKDVDSCDVSIIPSEDTSCRIAYKGIKGVDTNMSVNDGILNINCIDNRDWIENIGIGYWEETQINIYIPEKAYDELEVKTTSGDITFDYNMYFKNAEIKSVSGDINIADLQTENLDISSTSGDIKLGNLNTKIFTLSSTSGDLSLNGLNGEIISVSSTSGETEIKNVEINQFDLTNTSGEIELEFVKANEKAQLKTGSGDIDVRGFDAGTIDIKSISGDITGGISSNKHFITSTTSGNVIVPPSDLNGGDCIIETVSGDIKIYID